MRKDKKVSKGVAAPKREEGALEGADSLLETLLDHTHMMVAYLDPKFNFVRVNRAYAEADGRVPSFFPGKNHFDLYPNAENQEIFQRVVETGEPYFAQAKPFEYAEHPERGVTYWDWSLIPVKRPAGPVTGLVLTLVNVTERKLAERALSESEERLRSFMGSATDSFVLWDEELKLVEANEAALETFAPGARMTEMIGKNILELVPALKKTGRYERYLEVIRTAKPFHVDDVIVDPRFGERSVAVTAFKVGDGMGMVVTDITERKLAEEALRKAHDELEIRVEERTRELNAANIGLQAEIAERKQAEEKLRESEASYKTLVETSNDMIFTVDLKGNFLFTNQAFRRLLGYSTEEIKRTNGFELVHPEDLEIVKAQFALLLEGKSVGDMEYRYKTKDGSYISILNNASPIFDPKGNVVAALGAARDITRRKRAEKALQESELWMRNMFNSLEEAVLVITPDRALVNINEAAKRMFGYAKDELVDLSTEVLHVDHEHYVEFGRRIREAFDRKQAASFEFEAKRKNGEVFPTEHTVTLLKNDVGESVGIVSVVRDVTERRRAEKELNLYREHLEELVEERTAELKSTNEQLAREITERKRAEEGLEWELAVNKELARASGALITTIPSIQDIANMVLDSAKSLTRSEHGYVSSIDPKTRDNVGHTLTEMMGNQCLVSGADKQTRFPQAPDGSYRGLGGHTLNSREGFLTNSPETHKASRGIPEGHIPLQNFLSVPAMIGEELVGQIALANSTRDYTERDLEAVKRLAEMYAMAIQRRRAEKALKAEREFTEKALNAQTDTFFVFEPATGRAVRWNGAFNRISGYTDEEIRSMKAPDSYYNEEDLKKAAAAIQKILKEEVATVELSLITKDGISIPTEYTASAITDDKGNTKYIIAIGRDITERRRAEEALRESEEKFRGLAEQSPNMIFINKKGRVVYANRRCEEIMGCKREEFYSPDFDFFDLIAPESKDLVKENFSKHARNEEVRPYEYTLCTKEGKRIEAILNSELITYGGETAILGIVTDITERKGAEEELRKSKELFEKTFLSQQDAIFILDAKIPPTIVDCNPSATKTFGFARQEMLGRTTAFLHSDETALRDFQARVYPAIERQGFVYLPEFQMKRKDGAILQTEHALMSLTDQQGRRIGWVSVVRDITERKQAEEELQRRTYDLNERVRELNCLYNIGKLIETPGMSLEQIFQGTVDLIPAAWRYPEITCARLVLGDRIFASSNFRETAWNQASDVTAHGNREGALDVHYLEERPEGDEGPFLAEERSLLEAIVERLGRVIERKRAEEEIRKLNRSLKMQAADLAASNKELEAFSYSVSHDLRAPLRSIDGFGRALLEDYADKLDEEGRDYLNRVRAATQRMGHLIDDLLNLSLMMRREIRREEIDLSELAHTIGEELRKTQPERQVEFVIQEGALAQGDARLLREMLENLLGNAWKFTGKNPRSRIEFGVTEQEGQRVYFVRDDGAGFDMAYADKLFVPFQRLHSTGEFSGNGIGLTIASRIVNRHGGQIWAEGELEKGATFYFTLQ